MSETLCLKSTFSLSPNLRTQTPIVPHTHRNAITKSGKFLGYILAQYIDEDDEDPTRTECVELYIEDALPKHRAYLHRLEKD